MDNVAGIVLQHLIEQLKCLRGKPALIPTGSNRPAVGSGFIRSDNAVAAFMTHDIKLKNKGQLAQNHRVQINMTLTVVQA